MHHGDLDTLPHQFQKEGFEFDVTCESVCATKGYIAMRSLFENLYDQDRF